MNDIFKIYDFEDEEHWLKGRMNGIGGSDASAVIGKNPYKSNIDLFEEKTGRTVPEDISDKPYVIYGKKAEEYIRELFKLDYPERNIGDQDHQYFTIYTVREMEKAYPGQLLHAGTALFASYRLAVRSLKSTFEYRLGRRKTDRSQALFYRTLRSGRGSCHATSGRKEILGIRGERQDASANHPDNIGGILCWN